jgi:hypothetical protein
MLAGRTNEFGGPRVGDPWSVANAVRDVQLPAISFNSRRLGPIPRGRLSAVGVEVRDLKGRRAGVQGSAPT